MATQNQVLEDAYRGLLISWQVPITPSIQAFMRKMAAAGASTSRFVLEFRKTKAYARKFQGIMRGDGTLRMSEAQYIAGYNSARDYAASLGRPLSPQMYGLALANGNSPSEIRAKIQAADKLREFKPNLQQFNDYLLTTGKIKKPLERGELLEFMMGQREDLEQEWTVAYTAAKAQKLGGFDIGRPNQGGDIGYRGLRNIIKKIEGTGGDIEAVDFAELGRLADEVLPKSQLYGAGIRKKDLLRMTVGDEKARNIADRVQRVLATYQLAVTEAGAQSQNVQGRPLQGTPNLPTSE